MLTKIAVPTHLLKLWMLDFLSIVHMKAGIFYLAYRFHHYNNHQLFPFGSFTLKLWEASKKLKQCTDELTDIYALPRAWISQRYFIYVVFSGATTICAWPGLWYFSSPRYKNRIYGHSIRYWRNLLSLLHSYARLVINLCLHLYLLHLPFLTCYSGPYFWCYLCMSILLLSL